MCRYVLSTVLCGMTTSISKKEVSSELVEGFESPVIEEAKEPSVYKIRHTLASRFAFLVICVAIVTTALAYGTVHYWALGLFTLGALTILIPVSYTHLTLPTSDLV